MISRISIAMLCVAVLAMGGIARAESGTAYVGTVNAYNAFEVQDGGNRLYYTPQADTDCVWMNNNGSAPEVVATYTYQTVTYDRDGMKTYACSDLAYGQSLNTVKLAFDYSTAADPTTGYAMDGVAINFFFTDGSGHYGIWSATSGAALYTDAATGDADWTRRTLDCTGLSDSATVAVYEHNGLVDEYGDPWTDMTWGGLKSFAIAGFYDYQRTPQGGFEAWNQMLWSKITNVANPSDPTLNEYGITLNWGDTVGGCFEDGCGEIGDNANRPYGQAGRMIRNYELTVGATVYDMSFEAAPIPEPATMLLLGSGLAGMLGVLRRRRQKPTGSRKERGMKRFLVAMGLAAALVTLPGTLAALSVPDGNMSAGPYHSDGPPWWDTTNYQRVVTTDTVNAQTTGPVVVSGRLSDFSFVDVYGSPGWISFMEVGLMTHDEYNAMEDYDADSDNWDSSTARGSNRGIYLIICASEIYMEDWGGYWPPDGGDYPGKYYPANDGQTVLNHTMGLDSVLDFSFTVHPSGAAGGTVDALVDIDNDGDGTYDTQWSVTGLPYGRFNPASEDPTHSGDGSAWAIVEDYSQAHLFVNVLGYDGNSSFSYSDVHAAPVPEPATMLLVGSGLAGLATIARRRRQK